MFTKCRPQARANAFADPRRGAVPPDGLRRFRRAELVKAFLSSTEYRQRFGQP